MTISFHIRNFRGIAAAAVEVDPLALIGGRNRAGKSSIAQAVGAVLCGNALPLDGLTKAMGGVLVRDGTSHASVVIEGESGTARLDWPAGNLVEERDAPSASPYAAGLASIVTLSARERVRVLSDYLKAEPTRDDVRAALAQLGEGPASEPVMTAVWELLQQKGWDGAHEIRREKGAELKGQWRQVTGTAYGPRIAASWRPDLADEELSETELVALVEKADRERNRALAAEAVSSSERARLEAEAGKSDSATTELQQADAAVARLQRELEEIQNRRAGLPSEYHYRGSMPCPHCGGALILRRASLVETRLEKAPEQISEAELKQMRREIAEADGAISRLAGALTVARGAQAAARAAVHNASAARSKLAEMPDAPRGSAPDLAAARDALTRAEKRLGNFRQKREADDLHRRITSNDFLLDLLAPDGLRAKRLAEVLVAWNQGPLAALTAAAGWASVAVDTDMTLTSGGRRFGLLSASEQYQVRTVLQVAMAQRDKSAMVVIDAADTLDAPNRNGLFAMLLQAEIPALVCLTLSRREQLPNLAQAGRGVSYWIESQTAAPLPIERVAA
jgi:hypothetical protein